MKAIFAGIFSFALFSSLSATTYAAAPNPSLTAIDYFSGADELSKEYLTLKRYETKITINAGYAETYSVVEFFNPTDRVLEGDFILDMPAGSIVTGYGLDIAGRLRDGVIAEKRKAKEAFEDRIREGVDPGLAEATPEGAFKSRVFPIGPKSSRTIALKFVSPISETRPYQLPLFADAPVDDFSLTVISRDGAARPLVHLPDDLDFNWNSNQEPTGVATGKKLNLNGDLIITPQGAHNYALEHHTNGDLFLSVDLPESHSATTLEQPKSIRVYWDASLSHKDAAPKAKEFISRFDQAFPFADIEITPFSTAPQAALPGRGVLSTGDLLELIEYHGATNLAALFKSQAKRPPADLCILVTDGRATIGGAPQNQLNCRLYTLTGSKTEATGLLEYLAKTGGGGLINLAQIDVEEGLGLLERPAPRFTGLTIDGRVRTSDAEWVFDGYRFRLLVRLGQKPTRIRFELGQTVQEADLASLDVADGSIFGAAWATGRLAALRAKSAKREELVQLSETYSVASEETSFIVLETFEDYVENRIALPAEGFSKEDRTKYEELLTEALADDREEQENRLSDVIEMWNEQIAWYETDHKAAKKTDDQDGEAAAVMSPAIDTLGSADEPPGLRSEDLDLDVELTTEQFQGSLPADSAEEDDTIVVTGTRIRRADLNAPSPLTSLTSESQAATSTSTNPWAPQRPYLEAVKDLCGTDFLDAYFDLRTAHGGLPSFYLEMADALAHCGEKDLAVDVALSALELELANTDTITAVAHRLTSYGAADFAEQLFRRVIDLDPNRPQPWRDLALALETAGAKSSSSRRTRRHQYGQAIELLNHVVTNPWDDDYDGIELISIMDANNIIRRYKSVGGRQPQFPNKLQHLLDVDLRVVVTWNIDNVDMDLWVDEPTGERAIYSNPKTAIGGRLSNDMTAGYGPEEYLLKRTVSGDYKIKMNYFRSDIINPNGAVALRAHIYRNWGRKTMSEEIVDLEFTDDDENEYLVATVNVD